MTRAEEIAAGLAAIRARIAAAERAAGRPAGSVRLVAVSKKMSADDVRAALGAGQLDFGENYAQELRDKRAALLEAPGAGAPDGQAAPAPRWHYIGPLQRNKVKLLAGQIELIQAVDSPEVLAEIDRQATARGAVQDCLVQVNVAAEAQKHGVLPQALPGLLDHFAAAAGARCRGLMLIPPLSADREATRRWFRELAVLAAREAERQRPHVTLAELSMGMSDDFEAAIADGATMVRVGTSIFGARPRRAVDNGGGAAVV
jgi:PLP dependent protein